jgi:hypothetical protein
MPIAKYVVASAAAEWQPQYWGRRGVAHSHYSCLSRRSSFGEGAMAGWRSDFAAGFGSLGSRGLRWVSHETNSKASNAPRESTSTTTRLDIASDSATEGQKSTVSTAEDSKKGGLRGAMSKGWELWKRYGIVAVGTYYVIYTATLGGAYFAFSYGLIPELDVGMAFQKMNDLAVSWDAQRNFAGIDVQGLLWDLEYACASNPAVKNGALAFIATELTEPVRYGLVLLFTPKIARMLGRVPQTEQKV